jgi:hypothetical protein
MAAVYVRIPVSEIPSDRYVSTTICTRWILLRDLVRRRWKMTRANENSIPLIWSYICFYHYHALKLFSAGVSLIKYVYAYTEAYIRIPRRVGLTGYEYGKQEACLGGGGEGAQRSSVRARAAERSGAKRKTRDDR